MLMKQFPQKSRQSSDKVICIAMVPDSAGGAGLGYLPWLSMEFSKTVRMEPRRRLEVESPRCALRFTVSVGVGDKGAWRSLL